ncbi:Riboflavin kinase protein [Marine Group I thaumarchaeote SCGC AAA799-O18]|jgi:riboflavin kinase|nr:Riboflavin kinase protein [Marine Group I thaumarchaeote SCGC AAA799-O18]
MPDLKIQHILILTQLLSKGARYNFVQVTTSSLGKIIKKSQQAASTYILDLENNGLIERLMKGRKISVKITHKGYSELLKLHSVLGYSLDSSPSNIELRGSVVSGLGEGSYYMSLKGYTRQFKSKIGYIPFPGTLNIKLNQQYDLQAVQQLVNLEGISIDPFSDGKRTYGWVKCYHAKLNNSINCELIRLERTHHGNSVIELISKNNLRKIAGIKTGSKVKIKILTHT